MFQWVFSLELPSAVSSISPTSDEKKVSTVGYFDYGVWLIAPIEDLYSIAPLGQLIQGQSQLDYADAHERIE